MNASSAAALARALSLSAAGAAEGGRGRCGSEWRRARIISARGRYGWCVASCASLTLIHGAGIDAPRSVPRRSASASSARACGGTYHCAFSLRRVCHPHLTTNGTSCPVIELSSGCVSSSGRSGARRSTYTYESSSVVLMRACGCFHRRLMRSSRSDAFLSDTSSESMMSSGLYTGSALGTPCWYAPTPSWTRMGARVYAVNRFAGPSRSRSLPVPSPAPRS